MSFDLSNYFIDYTDRRTVKCETDDGVVVVGELEQGWKAREFYEMISRHASEQWESSLPEGVQTERTLSVDAIWDFCSVGAGAVLSPAGPVGVVVLELQSSARPDDPPFVVNLAMPPDQLRDLRQKMVTGFGEAIKRAVKSRRILDSKEREHDQ